MILVPYLAKFYLCLAKIKAIIGENPDIFPFKIQDPGLFWSFINTDLKKTLSCQTETRGVWLFCGLDIWLIFCCRFGDLDLNFL